MPRLILLSLLTLAWSVSTSYSISVDLTPARENGSESSGHTMQSYHSGGGGGDPRMPQTITFPPISDRVFGQGGLRLIAEASSDLDVSFQVNFGPASLDRDLLSFTGPGRVSIKASQAGDNEFHQAVDVTQSFEVISTWDNWLMTNFLESERSQPSITGDNADADGDGLLNVIEYALGLDPRDPSSLLAEEAAFVHHESGDYFVCTITRNRDALDVSISIEESVDLTSWTPVATSVNGSTFQTFLQGYSISETNGGSVNRVELSSPISSAAGYFQRIVVVR